MQVHIVPIDELSIDPANVRKHGGRDIDAIKASLKRFGQQHPILVDKRGVVRAGNGRLEAMRQLGWSEAEVVYTDLEGAELAAFAIADNRTAELSGWDVGALSASLAALKEEDEDLFAATGFDDVALAQALDGIDPGGSGSMDDGDGVPDAPREIIEDEAPEAPKRAVSKTGDLWLLGDHRVLCGDSTSAEDVGRLMDGERVGLCFTSPPYGQQREYGLAKDLVSEWDALMAGALERIPMLPNGQVLVNLGMIHRDGCVVQYWQSMIAKMEDLGWNLHGWYVWDQGPGMPGASRGRLASSHEFIWHFNIEPVPAAKVRPCAHAGALHSGTGQRHADGSVRKRTADGAPIQTHAIHDSVFRVNRQGAMHGADGHPAPYPVGLPMLAIESWPCNVFDPFLGSGTTLIAAEQLDRKCYGLELEPRYVDVIVQRWEKLTGKQATLDGSGMTFEEAKSARWEQ